VTLPGHRGVRAYQVFARHDKEPALRHVGEVQASNDEDAVVFAHTLYTERRWQDLFVVPHDAMIPLVRPE
jgi:1,2-phenylacetyl-CoA epoxidase PaaB subunit